MTIKSLRREIRAQSLEVPFDIVRVLRVHKLRVSVVHTVNTKDEVMDSLCEPHINRHLCVPLIVVICVSQLAESLAYE